MRLTLQPRRPFLAFLYTIARNVVTDGLRRSRPQASFEDALAHPSDAQGPEERAAASDEVRELRAAIAKLTPVQQEVMVLMLEDRSVKEIAQLTGKREGTIRGIHMRMKRLVEQVCLGLEHIHERGLSRATALHAAPPPGRAAPGWRRASP